MLDGMAEEKKLLATAQPPADESNTAVLFERLRGIVLNEEDDTQDYELVVTADEIMLRGLKNQGKRIPDSERGVFLVYGRNLNETGINVIKDLLKLCRTQVSSKKILKKREDVPEDKVAEIQAEFFN